MSYKTRNQRIITLPSGAVVTVRKLVPEDYLSQKEIPVFDVVGMSQPSEANLSPEQRAAAEDRRKQRGIQMRKTILTRCCGPIRYEGETLRIVDKSPEETRDDEIAIELLDPEDSTRIADTVVEMSGLSAAPEAARPFPQEQEGGGQAAPVGQVISLPSDGPPQAANG